MSLASTPILATAMMLTTLEHPPHRKHWRRKKEFKACKRMLDKVCAACDWVWRWEAGALLGSSPGAPFL